MKWNLITFVSGKLIAMILMLLLFWYVFGLAGFVVGTIIMAILAATM